jgi:hypothetical protein
MYSVISLRRLLLEIEFDCPAAIATCLIGNRDIVEISQDSGCPTLAAETLCGLGGSPLRQTQTNVGRINTFTTNDGRIM